MFLRKELLAQQFDASKNSYSESSVLTEEQVCFSNVTECLHLSAIENLTFEPVFILEKYDFHLLV